MFAVLLNTDTSPQERRRSLLSCRCVWMDAFCLTISISKFAPSLGISLFLNLNSIFFLSHSKERKKILNHKVFNCFCSSIVENWYVTAPDVWCIVNYYTKNRRTTNIATSTSRHSPRRLQASARLLADYVKLVPHSLCPSSLRQTWWSRAADILGIDLDRRSCVNEI
jgi:hypothetical protein